MLEWVQSIEGIMTITLGGVSFGTIIAFVITSIKNIQKGRSMNDIVNVLVQAKEIVDKMISNIKDKENELAIRETEIKKRDAKDDFILKSLSIIIAASGGIDATSKLELINDLTDIKKKIAEEIDIKSIQLVKETTTKVLEESKEVVEKVIKESTQLVEKYSKR